MKLSREINDFLGAWKATNDIVGNNADKQYKALRNQLLQQQYETNPALTQSKLDYYGLRRGNVAAATKLINERIKKLNAPAPQQGSTIPLPAPYAPQAVPVEPTPAAPNASPNKVSALDMEDLGMEDLGGEEYEPTQFAASGGAIGDDDQDDFNSNVSVSDSDEDDSAPETGEAPGFSYAAAHDAVRDGLQYQVAQAQQAQQSTGAVDVGAAPQRTRRTVANDAVDPRQMEAIFKAVDPTGKLSVGERGMAAFGHVYTHFLGKGDVQGAQRAANGMLQYYNIQSNKWQAIARAAAENGDLNGTVKALVKSYENVPDGMDINVVKQGDRLGFEFKDAQTGKTMRKFVASPNEILNAVTRGNIPGFEELIVQSAGRRHQASKGQGARANGSGAPSSRDLAAREKAAAAISTEAEAQDTVGDTAQPRYKLPAGNETGVKDVASSIYRSNDLSPHDAMRVATGLVDPSKPNDMLTPTEDGGAVVKLGDGREVKLSRNAYLQALAIRGKATKTKQVTDTKEAENAAAEKADYEKQKKAFGALNEKAKAAKAAESKGMDRRRYKPGAIPEWALQDEQ